MPHPFIQLGSKQEEKEIAYRSGQLLEAPNYEPILPYRRETAAARIQNPQPPYRHRPSPAINQLLSGKLAQRCE